MAYLCNDSINNLGNKRTNKLHIIHAVGALVPLAYIHRTRGAYRDYHHSFDVLWYRTRTNCALGSRSLQVKIELEKRNKNTRII